MLMPERVSRHRPIGRSLVLWGSNGVRAGGEPLLAIPLVLGILIGIGALFLRINSVAFGEPRGENHKAKGSYVPMFAHLALVLAAGIYLPGPLVTWFQNVAKLLG